jgi:hypothetical protein
MTTYAAPAARLGSPGLRRHAGAAGIALVLGILAAAHGGYFPTSWGWSTVLFLWAAAMVLLLGKAVSLSRAEAAFLAAAVALVGWIALSVAWSVVRVESVEELERAFVYVSALAALVLLVRPRSVPALLGTTTAAIALVCCYAVATRLLPDRIGSFDSIGGYRLSEPVGYWNALGIFAAMGAVLAVGQAAKAASRAGRSLGAGALPVLVLALYFTFSRGSWLALAVGLAVMVALEPARLRLLVSLLALAPPSAVAVWLAWRSHALTTLDSAAGRAAHDGHRLALALVVLVAASAAVPLALAAAEARVKPGRLARHAFVGCLAGACLGVVLAVAAAGGPLTVVRKAVHSFESAPVSGTHLTSRVFTLSSNGRLDLWRAAWHEFEAHPVLGGGAGSYEQYWRVHRPNGQEVRDAHSLYLETAAELGIVGLGLLGLMLAAPFRAARSRRLPLVPVALGAYAAYLVHAGVDWDWEMPAVTVTALVCGAAALISARDESRPRPLPSSLRYAGVALAAAVGAFALACFAGNRAASASVAAASTKKWGAAAADARTAHRWLPWSAEPWELLGNAQFGAGDFPAAATAYRRAIASDPRNWQLWFDLGYATSGRESTAAFARARALDPQNPDIPRAGATHVAR